VDLVDLKILLIPNKEIMEDLVVETVEMQVVEQEEQEIHHL
tara:strand:- start:397 stop:519 length:123 start_codon:yes stop_codon:yes gene_type:complete